jgi:pimeloyl-ACP methyl ester carboxylesterase
VSYSERPLFIPGAPPLYGVLCRGNEVAHSLLLVTGFGEEKKSSYRVLVDRCRELAGQGVASLRFDLRGTGDSDYPFNTATVADWASDIVRAHEFLATELPIATPVLCGVRLGGLLIAAADVLGASVVLVAPPASGGAYLREEFMRSQLRAAITGRSGVNPATIAKALDENGEADLDGLRLSKQLADGIAALSWQPLAAAEGGTRYIVSIGPGATPQRETQAVAATLGAMVSHLSSPPFWSQTDHLPVTGLADAMLTAILDR